jgi:hypothetical protein
MNVEYDLVIYILIGILSLLILILLKQYISKPPGDKNHPLTYQDHSSLVEMHLNIEDKLKKDKHFNKWWEDNKKM